MSAAIEEKIHGYLDDSLNADEMTELANWIKADSANARKFAQFAMLHDRLQGEMSALEPDEPGRKILRFPIRQAAAAAAVALLAAGIALLSLPKPGPDAFVTIARADGTSLEPGERRGTGRIRLESGFLRLQFDNGVDVTLQGPAEFELVNEDRMILTAGLLTANVPPGAEGFRVDTPTAQITDLGTAFGVHLDRDGGAHVSVFDGEVEIEEPNSGTRQRLTEGEEVVVTRERRMEPVQFDVTPYERLWPVSTGIAGSTGSFKLAPPWPRRLGLQMDSDHIIVVPDGYRIELDDPLRVNMTSAGRVTQHGQLTPSEIPAGTPLRSYILQYRPEETRPRRFPNRLSGTITFDRPIAGLIVLHEEMRDSVGRFSPRKTGEVHPNRELELNGRPNGDRVTLSEDRHTLTVDLGASRRAFDLIRVVVDASLADLAQK